MQVALPAGAVAGGPLQIMTPSGPMMVQVPPGLREGDTFTIQVPAQVPMAVATAVAGPSQPMAAPLAEPVKPIMPVAATPAVAHGVAVAPETTAPPPATFERIPAQHTCQFCGERAVTRVEASPRALALPPPPTCLPAPPPPARPRRRPARASPTPRPPAQFETGFGTYLMCGASVFFGCWLGCCLIPFCVDELKDAVHHCSKCGRSVGVKTLVNATPNQRHTGTTRS